MSAHTIPDLHIYQDNNKKVTKKKKKKKVMYTMRYIHETFLQFCFVKEVCIGIFICDMDLKICLLFIIAAAIFVLYTLMTPPPQSSHI